MPRNCDSIIEELTRLANYSVLKDIQIPSVTNNPGVPLMVRSLQDHLMKLKAANSLLLPDLVKDNQSIMAFSDYGGESSDSNYLTYSFLIVTYDSMGCWLEESQKIRNVHKLNEPFKEVAFKDIDYGPVDRCLYDWLKLSDFLRGLLFTFAVSRRVVSISGRQDTNVTKQISMELTKHGFGKWKPHVSEKLMRVLHPLCFLISFLSSDGQKLFWMTDDDAIAANDEKLTTLGRLLASVLSIYTPNKYSAIGYAKPFEVIKNNQYLNDLLSIPDLAAGSISTLLTQMATRIAPQVKDPTNRILEWLSYQGIGLKKHMMLMDLQNDSTLKTAILKFEVINETREIQYIPIWL